MRGIVGLLCRQRDSFSRLVPTRNVCEVARAAIAGCHRAARRGTAGSVGNVPDELVAMVLPHCRVRHTHMYWCTITASGSVHVTVPQ